MKIALVNASDKGRGAEEFVMTLHRMFRAAGHQSTVYVGTRFSEEPDVVEIPYVRGIPGGRRLARAIENATGWQDIYNPSFRNLDGVIPADTDVIHFNNLWGSSGYADLSALPRLTRRISGVFTEHQCWSFTGHCASFHDCMKWHAGCGNCPRMDLHPAIPKDGSRYNWCRKRRVVQKSDLTFVGVSDYVCSLARQSPIWSGKAIHRIYNGIDTQVFVPVSAERKMELRRRLGIPGDRVAILISGQTLTGYREGIATEGFQAINRLKDSAAVPVLVGSCSEDARANLNGASVAIGYRSSPSAMASCYQACDVTLVTSHVETFGRIPAESQACGTPVVSFDTGGLAEVVKNNVGGLSVRKGDLDGLEGALRQMVGNADLRSRLGTGGIRHVRQNFDSGSIGEQYINLFHSICSNR